MPGQESGAWRRQSSERAVDFESRASGPPAGRRAPRRSRHCRGGTAAGGRARTRRVVTGQGEHGEGAAGPGVLVLQPPPCPRPGATRPRRTARCTRVPLGGAHAECSPRARPSWCWSAAARTGGWRRGRAAASGYVPPAYLRRLQAVCPSRPGLRRPARLSSITGRSGPPADEDFENLTEDFAGLGP